MRSVYRRRGTAGQQSSNCFRMWWWGSVFTCLLLITSAKGIQAREPVALIDKIQAAYDGAEALTAEFVQVATLTSINRRQTSSGRMFIEKPHAIRWEYDKPEAQTILYDGTTLRIYTPKRQQVLQSAVDEQNRANVAFLFLAGVGKLREAFTITSLPDPAPQHAALRLLPQSTQASFTELQIVVSTENYFVETLRIHDTIGNITEIQLFSLQAHDALPEQTFDLVLPPETEVLTPRDIRGR